MGRLFDLPFSDKDGIFQYLLFVVGFDVFFPANIDFGMELFLKNLSNLFLDLIQVFRSRLKFYDQVNIATGLLLISGKRTEQPDFCQVVFAEQILLLPPYEIQYFFFLSHF